MPQPKPAELADYPVVISLPIQWGDQDAFGHVNNVVHFRWCESGRIAYLASTGLHDLLLQSGLGPILASIKCDYLKQLNFPDTVQIGTRITRLGTKSMTIEHAIYSEALQAIAARSDSVVVMFHYGQQTSCPIPPAVREKIAEIEGKSFPRG